MKKNEQMLTFEKLHSTAKTVDSFMSAGKLSRPHEIALFIIAYLNAFQLAVIVFFEGENKQQKNNKDVALSSLINCHG